MAYASHGGFPEEVLTCLRSSQFLELATSFQDRPHVGLMNYTFVPKEEASPFVRGDVIVMTSPRNTTKYRNIVRNPHVSMLVHDWSAVKTMSKNNSSTNGGLAQLLQSLNQAQLSRIAVTLDGIAQECTSPQEIEFFKRKHLQSNPNARCFIDDPDAALFLVTVRSARTADSENNVSDWQDSHAPSTPAVIDD